MAQPSESQPGMSWRLLFRFKGRNVRLAEARQVEMIAPTPGGGTPKAGTHSGSWLELQADDGGSVFARRLYDPFRTIAEHHSPDGKIEAVTRAPEEGEFEVIVPHLPAASDVVLFSSEMEGIRTDQPAYEVGRFKLREKRPKEEEEE